MRNFETARFRRLGSLKHWAKNAYGTLVISPGVIPTSRSEKMRALQFKSNP